MGSAIVQIGELARLLFEDLGGEPLPSMDVHGDGVNTWEVAAALIDGHRPTFIEAWAEYLMPPPMSTDKYTIYGHVPTDVLIGYIEKYGGNADPIRDRLKGT